MAELDCTHDETIDLGGVALDWSRVDEEFGETAYCLACPCGSWIVESAHGEILARSESVEQHLARLPQAA